MAALEESPLSATNFAAMAVLAMAVAGRPNCLKKVLALGDGLLVAVDAFDLVEFCARQHQKILGDGQIVHIHHPQRRMVIAQIQHGGNIARMAVLKGNDAPGNIAAFHRVKHLVPGGIAHSLGVGDSARRAMWAKAPSTP